MSIFAKEICENGLHLGKNAGTRQVKTVAGECPTDDAYGDYQSNKDG